MAAKRFVKSNIDWAAFSERVLDIERPKYNLFKLKSDGYLKRVMGYPENPPAINWELYRSRIPSKALVDDFEKKYASVKVPYPADKLTPSIDAQGKEAEKELAEYTKKCELYCQYYNKKLDWWKNMIPYDEMFMDDLYDYFPEYFLEKEKNPTVWPHDEPTRPVFPYRETKSH